MHRGNFVVLELMGRWTAADSNISRSLLDLSQFYASEMKAVELECYLCQLEVALNHEYWSPEWTAALTTIFAVIHKSEQWTLDEVLDALPPDLEALWNPREESF